MADFEQNNQNDFMIEKIKQRPVNKAKLLRRSIITALMAVIFGLIACLTFLILEPVFSNWLYPEEEPGLIIFPEEQEEMSPEDMLSDNMQKEEELETAVEEENNTINAFSKEEIAELFSNVSLDLNHYKQLYSALSNYTTELNKSMVLVTAVSSDTDWFSNTYESKGQSSGLIYGNNGIELLILSEYETIKNAEKITVTYHNNVQEEAVIKQYNQELNLAILSVSITLNNATMIENEITLASLGSSNYSKIVGTPVVVVGSPLGKNGSIGYGMITYAGNQATLTDANYNILTTDIVGGGSSSGVVFNLQGQVIGIVTNQTDAELEHILSAYAITDLKEIVQKMSNGVPIAYLGISGVDVTEEAHTELNVPYGAYIKEVKMDSPAMLMGIQSGDIIVSINEHSVEKFSDFGSELMKVEAGQEVQLVIMRQSQEEYKEMDFIVTTGESN